MATDERMRPEVLAVQVWDPRKHETGIDKRPVAHHATCMTPARGKRVAAAE